MTNQQDPNPSEMRDRATSNQQQLLEQYSQLIAQNTEQATITAVNDQLTHYELLGIQKGYQSAKKQITGMMQEKLEELNQQDSDIPTERVEKLKGQDLWWEPQSF